MLTIYITGSDDVNPQSISECFVDYLLAEPYWMDEDGNPTTKMSFRDWMRVQTDAEALVEVLYKPELLTNQ